MNAQQLSQQIKKELRAVTWPTGTATQVFGDQESQVMVYAGAPTEDQFPRAFPCAMILIGDGTPDDDEPTSILQRFRIITGVQVFGDAFGEQAIIGGPPTGTEVAP